ncbi:hypothetical protein M3J09_000906 [Ascochyta lentis]
MMAQDILEQNAHAGITKAVVSLDIGDRRERLSISFMRMLMRSSRRLRKRYDFLYQKAQDNVSDRARHGLDPEYLTWFCENRVAGPLQPDSLAGMRGAHERRC